MASTYQMQVVERKSGRVVVAWPPGLAAEHSFVDDLVARVRAKHVGVWRTEAHVLAAVREAVEASLLALKSQVSP